MRVLRKRSSWVLPAATLLLGALALGLVGCGGSDNTPFPPNNFTGNAPTPRTADFQSAPAVTGQPTVLNSGPAQLTVNGLPAGSTLGASILPTGVTTLPSIDGLGTLAEFQLGTVGDGGLLNLSCPDATFNSLQITLTDAQLAQANQTLANGGSLVVYKNDNGTFTKLNLHVSLTGNVVTITSDTPLSPCGDFVVTTVAAHAQGSLG
jgi:hypothetical protein